MTFNTVLYRLQHPRNIGMIIRSHLAFGGDKIIFVGDDRMWELDDECIQYATNLQSKCEILRFLSFDEFLFWSRSNGLRNYAIEISESATNLTTHHFLDNCNFILGNEIEGIPGDLLKETDLNLVIPQYGPVGCLNVAVAASIAFYEFSKSNSNVGTVVGSKYLEG